ncbi:hypothetical protein KCP73_14830 [Salmonella enterica subsp. enterica]|nr:hypothetical protein KCP73_14830 [Salmonella enterica subsp. enterica]
MSPRVCVLLVKCVKSKHCRNPSGEVGNAGYCCAFCKAGAAVRFRREVLVLPFAVL